MARGRARRRYRRAGASSGWHGRRALPPITAPTGRGTVLRATPAPSAPSDLDHRRRREMRLRLLPLTVVLVLISSFFAAPQRAGAESPPDFDLPGGGAHFFTP